MFCCRTAQNTTTYSFWTNKKQIKKRQYRRCEAVNRKTYAKRGTPPKFWTFGRNETAYTKIITKNESATVKNRRYIDYIGQQIGTASEKSACKRQRIFLSPPNDPKETIKNCKDDHIYKDGT